MKSNKVGGVYQIRSLANNHIYIGSTAYLAYRKRDHFRDLERNEHPNKHLQSAWNLYGEQNFVYEILLICSCQDLLLFEQMCIDSLKPEYNIRTVAESNLGLRLSPASRERKARIGRANKGRLPWCAGGHHSKESIQKMRIAKTGHTTSSETKLKISITKKGHNTVPPESRKRGDEKRRSKHPSDETRQRMSDARRKYYVKKREINEQKTEEIYNTRSS